MHTPSTRRCKKNIYFARIQQTQTHGRTKENVALENGHWNVQFSETVNGHGVTEKGSSGSPLFNQNGLIVGTLTGGTSSCTNPNGRNLFGKLHYFWDMCGKEDNERLDIWLDPNKTGVSQLQGRYATEA